MSYDAKDLKLAIQKSVELGFLDSWLQGIAEIVPRRQQPNSLISNLKKHTISHTVKLLRHEIENMLGFKQIINACVHHDIRIDFLTENEMIEINFDPKYCFADSILFDRPKSNIIPFPLYRRRG